MNSLSNKNNLLNDVLIMRPIAIVCLILMHSFIIYRGGWTPPEGMLEIPMYGVISKICCLWGLELFVFISGYVYSFQRNKLGKKYTIVSLVKSKFKRLIIPSIFFSILYYICFNLSDLSWYKTPYDILNGCGNLWFLPMLFWCFIVYTYLLKFNLSNKINFLIVFLLTFISILPLPFRINQTLYYLFFFHIGYILFLHREKVNMQLNPWCILALFISIVFLFTMRESFFEITNYANTNNFIVKYIYFIINNLVEIVISLLSIILIYIVINRFRMWCLFDKDFLLQTNSMCFGIYIIHQSILMYLYYHTAIFENINQYFIPFLCFLIAFLCSIIIVLLLKKSKLLNKLL